ncbi:hypothetical protein BUE80_DR009059 [Diplocarpon rosae]|nr:hypothetical protein BUE80_DR009059 [Diplocarpon rosae]
MAQPNPPNPFEFQVPEGGFSFRPSSSSSSSSSTAPNNKPTAFAFNDPNFPQLKLPAYGGSLALARRNGLQEVDFTLEHETHPDTEELRKVRGLRDLAIAARDIEKGLKEGLEAEKVAMLDDLTVKDAFIEELKGIVKERDTGIEVITIKYNQNVAEYNEMHDELTERNNEYNALIGDIEHTRLLLRAAKEHNEMLEQSLVGITDDYLDEEDGLLIEQSHAALQTVLSYANPEGPLDISPSNFKDASTETDMDNLVDPDAEKRPDHELSKGEDLSEKLKKCEARWMKAEKDLEDRNQDLKRNEEQTAKIQADLEAEKAKFEAAEATIKTHAEKDKNSEQYIKHIGDQLEAEQEKVKELEEKAKLYNSLKVKLKQAEADRDVWFKRELDNSESAKLVYARATRLEEKLERERGSNQRLTERLEGAERLQESLLESEKLLEAAYATIEKLRAETPAFNPLPDANNAPARTKPMRIDKGLDSGLSDLDNQSFSGEAFSSSNESSTRLSEMDIESDVESDEAISETESEQTLGDENSKHKTRAPGADDPLDESGYKIRYVDRPVPAETKIIHVPQIEIKEVIKEVKGDPYPVPGEVVEVEVQVEVPGPVRYISTGGGYTNWFSTELAIFIYFLHILSATQSSFAQVVRGVAPIASDFHHQRERDSGSSSDPDHETDSAEEDDNRSLTDDTEGGPVTTGATGTAMSAVVIGGPANLGDTGSGPAPGTDPTRDEEALEKIRRDPKFKEFLDQSRSSPKKKTDPEPEIDLSSLFPPLGSKSKNTGTPYTKVVHPQPDSTGNPPPPPPLNRNPSTTPPPSRKTMDDAGDDPVPSPDPKPEKSKKSKISTGGPPPPPPENLFTQTSPEFGTWSHFLWTLFWFALHCVFYYLCWVALSTYRERKLWRGANEATRAMLTNWLGYRYPTQGIFHLFLSPTHATAIDRSLMWVFSYCVDFKTYPMPG